MTDRLAQVEAGCEVIAKNTLLMKDVFKFQGIVRDENGVQKTVKQKLEQSKKLVAAYERLTAKVTAFDRLLEASGAVVAPVKKEFSRPGTVNADADK